MSRKKTSLLCALSAAAAAALLFPYEIKVEKGEGCCKPKKVSAKSLALYVSYNAKTAEKKAELTFVIPGYNAKNCRIKKGGKIFNIDGEELLENAKCVYDEAAERIGRKAKNAAVFAEAAFKKAEEALRQKKRELAEKKEKRILEEGFSFEEPCGDCEDEEING